MSGERGPTTEELRARALAPAPPGLPEGASRVECIEVTCTACGETLDVDGGNPHFRPGDDLAHELSAYDWTIANGRVLCLECAERAAPPLDSEGARAPMIRDVEPWSSLRRTAEAQRHSSADVHGVSVRPSHLLALLDALDAIRRNAEAWHGDDAAKGRALAVIARWAADPGSIPAALLDSEGAERQ